VDRHRPAVLLALIPLTLALAAAGLFFLQGGFGAGHGSFDQAILFLGLPASAITPYLGGNDVVVFLLLPTIANICLWYIVGRVVFHSRVPAA
jgi:hypothetical protein